MQFREFLFVAMVVGSGIGTNVANSYGTINYTLSTLVKFNGSNGLAPADGVIGDGLGNLYGTTTLGGSSYVSPTNQGSGTIFKIDSSHSFSTLANFNYNVNGSHPAGLLADANGNFFGTAFQGANSTRPGIGTIFELAAGANGINWLSNALLPSSGLTFDANGNLFGTNQDNVFAGDYGSVFQVNAVSHSLSRLATFTGTNGGGRYPGPMIADSIGDFFGTTQGGGTIPNGYSAGQGTIFEFTAAHGLVTLVSFNGADGAVPFSKLMRDPAGNLFGTTSGGGQSGLGTVFELVAGTNQLVTLASFNGANGANPFDFDGLISDVNGNLYGTTTAGGAFDFGTVFELTSATHEIVTLASFNGQDGSSPYCGLYADAAGNLFGTTLDDATGGFGTVFELSVPEPSSIYFMALASLCLLARKRT